MNVLLISTTVMNMQTVSISQEHLNVYVDQGTRAKKYQEYGQMVEIVMVSRFVVLLSMSYDIQMLQLLHR